MIKVFTFTLVINEFDQVLQGVIILILMVYAKLENEPVKSPIHLQFGSDNWLGNHNAAMVFGSS